MVLIALIVGACAGFLAWRGMGIVGRSDFDQLWYAARAFRSGGNPYDAVGPGKVFEWPYPLFYPLPAVLVAAPFSFLDLTWASVVFTAVSSALLLFVLGRDAPYRLAAAASFSFFFAAAVSQWSPLLIVSALVPAAGFILVAKPTIGLALWLYRPRWQSALLGAGFILFSLALRPTWPVEWLDTLSAGQHIGAPIAHLGGPIVLLALLRWRRPEARLLVALACVPHTMLLYEVLPLFLVPSSWRQAGALAGLTWVAQAVDLWLGPYPTLVEQTRTAATVAILFCYFPCLVMILKRPNEGVLPPWITSSFGWLEKQVVTRVGM